MTRRRKQISLRLNKQLDERAALLAKLFRTHPDFVGSGILKSDIYRMALHRGLTSLENMYGDEEADGS